jgi:hypothetical protein
MENREPERYYKGIFNSSVKPFPGSLGVAVVPPICGGRVKSKDIFMKRELGAKNTD